MAPRTRFVRDPRTGLMVPARAAGWGPTRRSFLGGVAAVSAGAIWGCGADSESTPDAGTDTSLDAARDATLDARTDVREVGVDAPDAADVAADVAAATTFRFAVVADTHVIDEWYEGPESNQLDTESMFFTEERFTSARNRIRDLQTPVDFVVHLGDLIHDYPPGDLEFMAVNQTRMDTAAAILNGFGVPFHMCFGNHDYEFRRVSREDSHAFFADKLGVQPWSSFEHRGWKFILLNTYTGTTHAMDGPQGMNGSLGEEQLLWLEAELAEEKPTFVFMHQMLQIMETNEVADLGVHVLMERYKETIHHVLAGHTHRWLDLGNQYGPPHRVIGATRYDEDCFVIAEVDLAEGTSRFLNEDTWTPLNVSAETWQEA